MSCERHAQEDAAYVLGALSPSDRLAYEEHLASCGRCSAAVRELAGLPGLLGRLDADEVAELGPVTPLPPSVLPALLAEAVRGRRVRRARWLAAAASAAAAVVAATTVAVQRADERPVEPPASALPPARTMAQVDQDRLGGSVLLEQVAWGTRVRLRCSYGGTPESVAALPAYALVVRTRDGAEERVATWRAVAGKATTIDGATASDLADISRVDVRTVDGRLLLRLDR